MKTTEVLIPVIQKVTLHGVQGYTPRVLEWSDKQDCARGVE